MISGHGSEPDGGLNLYTPATMRLVGSSAHLLSTLNVETPCAFVPHAGQQVANSEASIIILVQPLPWESLRRRRAFAGHLVH